MIKRINIRDKNKYYQITDYLSSHFNYDFFYIKDNSKIYPNDIDSIGKLFKETKIAYYSDGLDCDGIILVWQYCVNDKKRFYVKVNAKNSKIAKDLLTVLIWNFNEDMFVKLRKDSKLINTFKSKGFKFYNNIGYQIILRRKKQVEKPEK